MHRPPSSRRRSSYAPQLCAAGAFLLLLLSLTILHMRLSSSPHLLSFPFLSSSSNQSSNNDLDRIDDRTDDRIDLLGILNDDQKSLSPPADDTTTQNLFWDHILGVARISFDRTEPASAFEADFTRPDLAFGSDDEPVDEAIKAKLASLRQIEDVLLLENSLMRDGWAKWLEGKGDFIKRDKMLRFSNHEMLNPRNHLLLQDPDVAGLTGMTRGDRMMQKVVLKEMDEGDLSGLGVKGRRTLDLKVGREEKDGGSGFFGVDLKVGFSEFVDRFFDGGLCSLRVFMVWNGPSWGFGVRHRRGVESLMYHHRNACVVMFSETVELDFFKEFVKDG